MGKSCATGWITEQIWKTRVHSFFQREADLTTGGSPPKARLLFSHFWHCPSPAEHSWDATCALRSGFRALRDTCCHTAKFSTASGGNLWANSTWKQKVIETKQTRKQFDSPRDENSKCAGGLLQIYYVKKNCVNYFSKIHLFIWKTFRNCQLPCHTQNWFFQLLEAMLLMSRKEGFSPSRVQRGTDRTGHSSWHLMLWEHSHQSQMQW